jgi:taurine--2-oxoglutarate transaminase
MERGFQMLFEGGRTQIAAFIIEPIVGGQGVIVPPDGYLEGLRELCNRYEMLLIFDEVQTGFGRTGKWFAAEHWNVVPDIMCVAKGINAGYVPLAATIVRGSVADAIDNKVFAHGHTYSGHPLACAAAVATIQAYLDDNLIERADQMGEYLLERKPGMWLLARSGERG